MVISIDKAKAFDKIQNSFMIKTFSKLDIDKTVLITIKAMYDKHIASVISNGEVLEVFPLRSKTRQGAYSQHCYSIYSQKFQLRAIRQETEIKGIQIKKGEFKLSLLADEAVLHIEKPKYYTMRLLELIKMFGKFAGQKINAQIISTFIQQQFHGQERT